jgi:hypothetical protein
MVSAIGLALLATSPALASGPFFAEPVFVSTIGRNPTAPTAFFEGKLDIIPRDLSPLFYVAAWRALHGKPFSKAQAQALLPTPCCNIERDFDSASLRWEDERNRVTDKSPGTIRGGHWDTVAGEPGYIATCSEDALRVATRTLRQLIDQHGARDRWVIDWVEAQDKVFAACDGSQIEPTMPDGAPEWLRRDRAYQIAAAHLYLREFDRAAEEFGRIASNADSPWRTLSAYLVVRSLTRKADAFSTARPDIPLYQAARVQAEKVLADPALAEYHDDTRNLLRRILLASDPVEAGKQFEARLSTTDADDYLLQDIIDYRASKSMANNPMGRWVLVMSSPASTKPDDDQSLTYWREQRSLPWLVAAMTSKLEDRQLIDELIAASRQVDKSSPAYVHVLYHRIRLLILSDRRGEAANELDGVDFAAMDIPTRNQFLSLRMATARTAEEFFRSAPRRVFYFWNVDFEENGPLAPPFKRDKSINVEVAWRDELYRPNAVYFDEDAAAVFNYCLSLPAQVSLLRGQNWPAHLRRQLTIFAFVRAVALQRIATAQLLAADLTAVLPELREPLEALRAAPGDEERLFLMALVALRLPGGSTLLRSGLGYRIGPTYVGDYGPRWWGQYEVSYFTTQAGDGGSSPTQTCSLPFITQAVFDAARAERQQLGRVGSAPRYLGTIVLRYAAKHPDDARVPEALHLAVRATRYGEPDKNVSLNAYNLLHRKYPASPWTKKTPFWYGE